MSQIDLAALLWFVLLFGLKIHLCFHLGGETLSLDVIKKDLPSCSVSLLLESKWTFITQEVSFSESILQCPFEVILFGYLVMNLYATINRRNIRI